ncbi:hypothetical protein DSAG12_01478 [Promethearchaeum syntrophicum]|uniref:Uncharacterized protein n=1 Tax=Promethearchaeum syntrophicum TaxID=2594042 RepID=A0A5B9D9D9_9ARCH|nr:hypothetical protein [Candidatus Prometheoarchaeum syntrophicum]QEE15651.1 hypothetical protein DSAG12_01478 [Candidatus Prometheoarchaeum syntrophicum]
MARKKKKKQQESPSSTIQPLEQTKELMGMLQGSDDKEIIKQEKTESSEIEKSVNQSPPPPPPPPSTDSSVAPPISQEEQKTDERTTSSFFKDTGEFFNQLGEAYEARYSLWEKSDLTVMAILREIRKINEENTDQFVKAINVLDNKISKGFNEFLVKRSELERYSDTDYKEIAKNFQKTLDLLNFQIREFKLNQMVTAMFNIYAK